MTALAVDDRQSSRHSGSQTATPLLPTEAALHQQHEALTLNLLDSPLWEAANSLRGSPSAVFVCSRETLAALLRRIGCARDRR
jgi:hypothetical protein